MNAPSAVPPSRFFPAPSVPFDTEIAVVAASNVPFHDGDEPGLIFIAVEDAPQSPRFALVRDDVALDAAEIVRRVVDRLRWTSPPGVPAQRAVLVESRALADRIGDELRAAGMLRSELTFWCSPAAELAKGERLDLEALVGDDAWRTWANVEREILGEALAPAQLTEAQLDRSVQFKRRQQRETPSIRRFVARAPNGRPAGMIGYAPFGDCDMGVGAPGVLARLRDVAVLPSMRRRRCGMSLLRTVAARAIEECGATQILICGASDGAPGALYRRVGARDIGRCAMFTFTG